MQSCKVEVVRWRATGNAASVPGEASNHEKMQGGDTDMGSYSGSKIGRIFIIYYLLRPEIAAESQPACD
jgi:hypothetical protein